MTGDIKMSTKDTLENMAKNTFLAGLGSIDSSRDALAKSIDAAQEKSNSLYNELLSRGGEIQNKIFEKRDELQAKGRKFLGIKADKSQDEKIEQLNAKVDQLTTAVVALIEKRNAAKTTSKPKVAAKPKAAAKPKTEAKPKAAAKPKTEAKPKAAAKPKTAAKPKAANAKVATKTATESKIDTKTGSDEAKKAE